MEMSRGERRFPRLKRMVVNGAQASGIIAIAVTSGAKDAVAGTVLYHDQDGEIMLVVSDPATDTTINVQRGWGTVAAGALANSDGLTIIGNVHEEGAKPPTAKTYAATKQTNYTEIFRLPLYLTRTARKTKLRWDNTGPYREAKREALSLYSIEQEKAFINGNAVETTGSAGLPLRMTGGVKSFLTSNIKGGTNDTVFNVNGTLDEDGLDNICENIFRYGSNEKLVLCGSTFLRAITTLGKRNGTLNMVPQDRIYGMKVVEYITAFGSLMLKNHPLFSQHTLWRQDALVLDTNNLLYRYLDDTMFIKNRQDPGEDASKDEYLGECGMEVYFEETHAYINGVSGALIA